MEPKEKCARERKEIEQPITDDITVEENRDISDERYRDACAAYTHRHTTHTYLEGYCDPLRHATPRHTCWHALLSLFNRNTYVI